MYQHEGRICSSVETSNSTWEGVGSSSHGLTTDIFGGVNQSPACPLYPFLPWYTDCDSGNAVSVFVDEKRFYEHSIEGFWVNSIVALDICARGSAFFREITVVYNIGVHMWK